MLVVCVAESIQAVPVVSVGFITNNVSDTEISSAIHSRYGLAVAVVTYRRAVHRSTRTLPATLPADTDT
jgi:hypothetical protein